MDTEEKKKLTDTQLRIVQAVAGLISAAALILSIWLPGFLNVPANSLLNYLFIVIFLIIMFARRRIEARYRIRLNFYNLILIDGILAGILIYVVIMFNNTSADLQLSDTGKLLICIGLALFIAVLGIAVPLLRYLKRKNNDTVIPIRIPEKTAEEIEKEKENTRQSTARNSVSSKISEMTKELEEQKPESEGPANSLERRIAEMTRDLGEREADTDKNTDSPDEPADEPVDSPPDDENGFRW